MGKTRWETKLDGDNHIKSTEKNKTGEAKLLINEPSTSLSDYLTATWYYKYVGHLLANSHYIQIKKNQIKQPTVLVLHGCSCHLCYKIIVFKLSNSLYTDFGPTLSSNF